MKIEVDRYSVAAIDEIVNEVLIEDWKAAKEEIKRIKKVLKAEHITDSHKEVLLEDLKDHKKLRKAYEVILRYSLPHETAKLILGE